MAPSAQPRKLGLGRQKRLHGAREFARVRLAGERRACGCLLVNWHIPDAGSGVRLGVVTSRRLGGAVVRSRIRRLLREAFRLNQHAIAAPSSIGLVARASVVGKPLSAVERDLRRGLREAGLWRGGGP